MTQVFWYVMLCSDYIVLNVSNESDAFIFHGLDCLILKKEVL